MRHPQEMGRLEVESYLSHLVNVGNVSQSTHHQALSALLFLYKEVLGVGLPWLLELNRPNKPKRLPVALTHLEVQSVFKHLSGIHLLMAKMLYGTGMSIGSIKHLFTPKLKYHTRNCCSFLLPKPQNLASQRKRPLNPMPIF